MDALIQFAPMVENVVVMAAVGIPMLGICIACLISWAGR
jgi:hypothetical protein